ncbi:MAG: tetratricopeptide repeat protein [Terriglobia bacterium]
MKLLGSRILIVCALTVPCAIALAGLAAQFGPRVTSLVFAQQSTGAPQADEASASKPDGERLVPITIDYPAEESIFPPEITSPTFLWHDAAQSAVRWLIDITFSDGSPSIRVKSPGERLRIGEIDPRCISPTNQLPELSAQQASAHTWSPDDATWEAIKKHSVERPATVTITGLADQRLDRAVSRGHLSIRTSPDPVGAPIFYRDVPLMPSELQKGVIKPLSPAAIPLIAWRLRNVGEPHSRLLLTNMHTCANCHSFSLDGKTLGMDLDGPANDKGLYAIARVQPQMSISTENVISWRALRDETPADARLGFMSQVSPDGRYVVTTIRGPQIGGSYYVVNFRDYRFLQVFYPTRGILAWYDRTTGQRHVLPGADDMRYVQTDAVWSPDGKYLVFARAEAKEPYLEGQKLAEHANDATETAIQYNLYRIPFKEGKGGQPEPIVGASRNGMSNTFPKVSPDGRWIVFVKCRNGQLMRPDSQLYIVPAKGGQARRMRCNTPLMNSWHSFSPNGRWLVFSSKSRSPYTQMYLTHLDEEGNDSPAILIDNATAANRAANIPEFVNIPANGLLKIDAPAVEFYRLCDSALDLATKGQNDAAIAEWEEASKLDPRDAKMNSNLGLALLRSGKIDDAIAHFQTALEANPDYGDAHNNLGVALLQKGRFDEAIPHFQKALDVDPENVQLHYNVATAFYLQGRIPEALAHWREWLRLQPNNVPALNFMARLLATSPEASMRSGTEAVRLAERAVQLSGGGDPAILDTLAASYAEVGRFSQAVQTAGQALALATQQDKQPLAETLRAKIALYEAKTPFHETRPGASPVAAHP